jgi:hypothetical protein
VSNQKLEFTWRNSEQLEGDLVEAVTALKKEPGRPSRPATPPTRTPRSTWPSQWTFYRTPNELSN